MKSLIVLLFACIFGLSFVRAADAPPPADGGTEDKELLGTWTVTSASYRGEKNNDPVGSTFTFSADKIVMKPKGKDQPASEAAYLLIPKVTPKRIDLTPLDDSGKVDVNRTLRGIYTIDGDTLKICMNDRPGERRPQGFDPAQETTMTVLLVLKRLK